MGQETAFRLRGELTADQPGLQRLYADGTLMHWPNSRPMVRVEEHNGSWKTESRTGEFANCSNTDSLQSNRHDWWLSHVWSYVGVGVKLLNTQRDDVAGLEWSSAMLRIHSGRRVCEERAGICSLKGEPLGLPCCWVSAAMDARDVFASCDDLGHTDSLLSHWSSMTGLFHC
jgi:hypothetical protein